MRKSRIRFLIGLLFILSLGFRAKCYGAGVYNLGAFWHPRLTFGKTWTWISGASTGNQYGVFGTQGVSNSSNVPGARSGQAMWADSSGNIWVFGGWSYSGGANSYSNDFWKFTPSNSQWTWISGTSVLTAGGVWGTKGTGSTSNYPPSESGAPYCTDSSGNFWIFGSSSNDLWMFNPGNSQWSWVSGTSTSQKGTYGTQGVGSTSNVPGTRGEATLWCDLSGNLWLFGGVGKDAKGNSGYLNDLWKYTPTSSQWAWISGTSSMTKYSGVYEVMATFGTQGQPSASNTPGSHGGVNGNSMSWTDKSNNLWLFGGLGVDSSSCSTISLMNDLWSFNTSTSQWTWVAGSSCGQDSGGGNYGNQGITVSANNPPVNAGAATWVDGVGNLWLYGGGDYTGGTDGALWMFSPSTSLWTWIAGANTYNQTPVYGTLGVASFKNYPGARGGVTAVTVSSTVWLFGGAVTDSYNDLWMAQ
jgi:hypothetical protein